MQAPPQNQENETNQSNKIKTTYTVFSICAATVLFINTMGRQFYVNHYFDQSDHWSVSNLTYNTTHMATVSQGWALSSTTIGGQGFSVLAIILGGTLALHLCGRSLSLKKFYALLAVTGFLMIPILLWLVLFLPSPTVKALTIETPWSLSLDGDVWLDYRQGYKRFRTGGHHLMVSCPDGSDRSSQAYGRIYRHFATDTPGDYPPWPLCADYYSQPQSKLYRMCCANRTILQEVNPTPVFHSSKTIFLSGYLTYLGALGAIGIASFIMVRRNRVPRAHLTPQVRRELHLNPLSSLPE